ncbi:hypothetical protein KM043_002425 [Ampulex compressa]|nr:hypothetical protein KM043_002425 [Ampulex compressa]
MASPLAEKSGLQLDSADRVLRVFRDTSGHVPRHSCARHAGSRGIYSRIGMTPPRVYGRAATQPASSALFLGLSKSAAGSHASPRAAPRTRSNERDNRRADFPHLLSPRFSSPPSPLRERDATTPASGDLAT